MNGFRKIYKFFSKKSSSWQYTTVLPRVKTEWGERFKYSNTNDTTEHYGIVITPSKVDSAPQEQYHNIDTGEFKTVEEIEGLKELVTESAETSEVSPD